MRPSLKSPCGLWPLFLLPACQPSGPTVQLEVDFALPQDHGFISQVTSYQARVDYYGGAATGRLYQFTLVPGEADGGFRDGFVPTGDGETVTLEVEGLAEDPDVPGAYSVVSRASTPQFALDADASIELFMGLSGAFNTLPWSLEPPRTGQSATLLADNRVLIAGGADDSGTALASALLFDGGGIDRRFGPLETSLPTLAVPRVHHSATRLEDASAGKVLLAGGDSQERLSFALDPSSGLVLPVLDVGLEAVQTTATAELFDPDSDAFAPTGPLAMPRTFHQATPLADGGVLLCGGLEPDGAGALAVTSGCDRFQDSGFSAGPALQSPRLYHQLTLLDSGEVLITGGSAASALSTASLDPQTTGPAELYDPATDATSTAGTMVVPRAGHSALRLDDGRVLITGGYGWLSGGRNGEPELLLLSSAEVYTPETSSANGKP